MPYVRTVKTASGATAVQIVYSYHRGSRQIEHRAIVKTCGSRSLGGFRLGVLAGPFDEFSVDEGRSGADQGDEVGCVHGAPAVLR